MIDFEKNLSIKWTNSMKFLLTRKLLFRSLQAEMNYAFDFLNLFKKQFP